MQVHDQQKLYLKFASPVTLEYEADDLSGSYMFGADTDRDLLTPCCMTAVATADAGKVIFTPAADDTAFYDKVQTGGKTAGSWEIRATADNRCVASGMVIFSPGVVEPGYTPAPTPKVEYYNKQQIDALIAKEIGISESRLGEMIVQAVTGI